MSLIDLIYYEYLYMSLIDLIYYLNVNFDSCIITNKLDNINQTINNNLVIVHTKPNLSITILIDNKRHIIITSIVFIIPEASLNSVLTGWIYMSVEFYFL